MIVNGKQKIYRINGEEFHCGTAIAFRFIGGKWKAIILWYLRKRVLRFSEIKKLIPDITEKMLSLQLKALQKDGLITKKIHGKKPPFRSEYQLTPFGMSLIPVINKITNWGINYADEHGELV